MDKNQIEGISGIDFNTFCHLDIEYFEKEASELPGFEKLNTTTWYREVKVEGERRYILCLNTQLLKDQRQARRKDVVCGLAFLQPAQMITLQNSTY